MKSEHRHELAENDLSKLIDHGRDRIEPHTNKILLGLLAATVLIVGAIVVYRTTGSVATEGAADLVSADTAAEYDAVADKFTGTKIGLWARLRAAEEHLRDGIRLSLTNRPASNENLQSAQAAYEQVLKAQDVEPDMEEKALFGLAMCLEAQTSETTTTKPAIEAYQKLLTDFEDSRYAGLARDRIAALESDRAAEFYAWFHQQNPKPEDRPPPRDFPSSPFGGPALPQDSGLPADMPAGSEGTPVEEGTPAGTTEPAPAEGATSASESPSGTDAATPEGGAAVPASEATPATESAEQPATSESNGPALPATSEPATDAVPAGETPANP